MKSYFNLQVTEFPEQNIFGVKNIIGNVWEWTQDWWETKFTPTPKKNPVSATYHTFLSDNIPVDKAISQWAFSIQRTPCVYFYFLNSQTCAVANEKVHMMLR